MENYNPRDAIRVSKAIRFYLRTKVCNLRTVARNSAHRNCDWKPLMQCKYQGFKSVIFVFKKACLPIHVWHKCVRSKVLNGKILVKETEEEKEEKR